MPAMRWPCRDEKSEMNIRGPLGEEAELGQKVDWAHGITLGRGTWRFPAVGRTANILGAWPVREAVSPR